MISLGLKAFFFLPHWNRDLQKHLSHRCALVPIWCPEVWAEVWLLDVRGLVSGLADAGGRYQRLHCQWGVGSCRWGHLKFSGSMLGQCFLPPWAPERRVDGFTRLCSIVSLRGSWTCAQGLLWMLWGAISRRHLHPGDAETDPLLRRQPAHPLHPDLHSGSAGLPPACWLWGEDLTRLGTHTITNTLALRFGHVTVTARMTPTRLLYFWTLCYN